MVIELLVAINALAGLLGFVAITATGDCTAREIVCYPVLVFRELRKSYNRLGSAILTGASLVVYPSALIVAAIYVIAVGIVRSFNWAFRNREDK